MYDPQEVLTLLAFKRHCLMHILICSSVWSVNQLVITLISMRLQKQWYLFRKKKKIVIVFLIKQARHIGTEKVTEHVLCNYVELCSLGLKSECPCVLIAVKTISQIDFGYLGIKNTCVNCVQLIRATVCNSQCCCGSFQFRIELNYSAHYSKSLKWLAATCGCMWDCPLTSFKNDIS